jgi:hypothetical protein
MRKLLSRFASFLPRQSVTEDVRTEVLRKELELTEGFHADKYVLALANYFLADAEIFVETGTLAGSTAFYVGSTHPRIEVYSCEPDRQSFMFATSRCRSLSNVHIQQRSSPDFLYELYARKQALVGKRAVFWLDAHGYGFRWPLRDEIRFITSTLESAVIMIDDFKVPGRPEFGYDEYDGQECSFSFIASALHRRNDYVLLTPSYADRTSPIHGLRGVGTLVFGRSDLALPAGLATHFVMESVSA